MDTMNTSERGIQHILSIERLPMVCMDGSINERKQ